MGTSSDDGKGVDNGGKADGEILLASVESRAVVDEGRGTVVLSLSMSMAGDKTVVEVSRRRKRLTGGLRKRISDLNASMQATVSTSSAHHTL